MNEYQIEDGKEVDLKQLEVGFVKTELFKIIHKNVPIVTHDIAIEFNGGFLLVERDNVPAKNILCVIGGRINRGLPLIKSIQKKIKEECGLNVSNIKPLGYARTFFKTDPFSHGKGTDTLNLMFYAKGSGILQLDKLHKKPHFVKKEMYTPNFRLTLHPYVREILDKAMPFLNKE